MQVNISFDTETEKIETLKKLVDALQQLIAAREGKSQQVQVAQVTTTQRPVPAQTTGGCRVIPYEDMSIRMSQIFSGRR